MYDVRIVRCGEYVLPKYVGLQTRANGDNGAIGQTTAMYLGTHL
jgi:hypothetical protein